MPEVAITYPGPYQWRQDGIRRFGFNGISHQYCMERVAKLMHRDLTFLKMISCHLGNGASLAAIDGGHSVDTTMGFTPLEGLMMGSSSGSVDPGILMYLLRLSKISVEDLDHCLEHSSGLKGISGGISDMREILQQTAMGNQQAALALNLYIYTLKKHMGAMLAVLGRCDAVIFTGGIGENTPIVRKQACEAFRSMGMLLDSDKNTDVNHDMDVSAPASKIKIFVIYDQTRRACDRQRVQEDLKKKLMALWKENLCPR